MSDLNRLIVGNWKMNTTLQDAVELAAAIEAGSKTGEGVDIGIAPPFVWIEPVVRTIDTDRIAVGAQDCSADENGAHTGDVSATMLAELCRFVIVGHSERRTTRGDTDDLVRAKLRLALDTGLDIVLCVGESLDTRQAGDAIAFVRGQVDAALSDVDPFEVARISIAYEPIWAIGTGKTATRDDIEPMMAMLRDVFDARGDKTAAQGRLLYGGSVNPDNAAGLFEIPFVDGMLVGGASLEAASFLRIIESAARRDSAPLH